MSNDDNLKKTFFEINQKQQELAKQLFDEFLPITQRNEIDKKIIQIEKEINQISKSVPYNVLKQWLDELHQQNN